MGHWILKKKDNKNKKSKKKFKFFLFKFCLQIFLIFLKFLIPKMAKIFQKIFFTRVNLKLNVIKLL